MKWRYEVIKEPYRITCNIMEEPRLDLTSPLLDALHKMPIAVTYSEEVAKEIVESHNVKVEATNSG